jgi:cyclase
MILRRRDFLKFSGLGLAAASLPARLLIGQDGVFRELRRNAGIFSARGGTIGWLINPEGVVVVDSQFPDTARLCLDGIRSRSNRPIDALINTHHHGDHTMGNGVFREAAETIVAHARVPELQRRAAGQSGGDQQVYADTTFEESWRLQVGDETVRAKHYGPAHTGGDATIYFEKANVVHMGDLVFNRLYPFIDRPGGASIRGWLRLLESVMAEHSGDTLYVFGHGQESHGVTGSRADLELQRDFFTSLLETTQRAIRDGSSKEELAQVESLRGFEGYVAPVDWISLPAAFGVAYDELTEE